MGGVGTGWKLKRLEKGWRVQPLVWKGSMVGLGMGTCKELLGLHSSCFRGCQGITDSVAPTTVLSARVQR